MLPKALYQKEKERKGERMKEESKKKKKKRGEEGRKRKGKRKKKPSDCILSILNVPILESDSLQTPDLLI